MAKRRLMSVLIGLERDGKPWNPKPGEDHDFSQKEIELIEKANPNALRLPADDSQDKTMRATPLENMRGEALPTKLTGDKPESQVRPPLGGMDTAKVDAGKAQQAKAGNKPAGDDDI